MYPTHALVVYGVTLAAAVVAAVTDAKESELAFKAGAVESSQVIKFLIGPKPSVAKMLLVSFVVLAATNLIPMLVSHTEMGLGFGIGFNIMAAAAHTYGVYTAVEHK
jgi:hypothetical protein